MNALDPIDFIHALSFDDLPDSVIAQAKRCLLDLIASPRAVAPPIYRALSMVSPRASSGPRPAARVCCLTGVESASAAPLMPAHRPSMRLTRMTGIG